MPKISISIRLLGSLELEPQGWAGSKRKPCARSQGEGYQLIRRRSWDLGCGNWYAWKMKDGELGEGAPGAAPGCVTGIALLSNLRRMSHTYQPQQPEWSGVEWDGTWNDLVSYSQLSPSFSFIPQPTMLAARISVASHSSHRLHPPIRPSAHPPIRPSASYSPLPVLPPKSHPMPLLPSTNTKPLSRSHGHTDSVHEAIARRTFVRTRIEPKWYEPFGASAMGFWIAKTYTIISRVPSPRVSSTSCLSI